jgi:hypothetical protein
MVLINSGGFPPLQENKLDISWPDKPKMPKEPALPDTADEGFSFDKADLSDKM